MIGSPDAAPSPLRRRRYLHLQEEERRRIGADLHDGLGQYLTGIACHVAALAKQLQAEGSPQVGAAARISDLVQAALDRTRLLARGLCPLQIGTAGLASALAELAAQAQRLYGIRCEFVDGIPGASYSSETGLHLYRIAQEAIRNGVRHGRAEFVALALEPAGSWARLVIEDDGLGCDLAARPRARGLGLTMIAHRMALLGGKWSIAPRAPTGTRLSCTFSNFQLSAGES